MSTPPRPSRSAPFILVVSVATTLLLVLAPGLLVAAQAQGANAAAPKLAWALAATLLLVTLTRRLWPGLLLLLPFAAAAPIELWYTLSFDKPSDAHALGILVETNWHEASDFVGPAGALLVLAVVAAAAVGITAVWSAWRAPLRWDSRIRHWLLVASLLALAIPVLAPLADAEVPDTEPRPVVTSAEGDDVAATAIGLALQPLAQSYPAGLPMRLWEFARYQRTLAQLEARLASFHFNARPGTPAPPSGAGPREVHILVIGETGRPDRWQINGYGRPTSPRLAAQAGLTSFTDMVSPWAWTRMSVPVILTRKPGTEQRPFFAERSLITAFREAGFRTYWFSTQSPLGPHDSSIALHASEADEVQFINPSNYKSRGALDGDLLPLLDRVLARPEERQLIVLHTLGGHYNYAHRYPPAFERFTPSLSGHSSPSLQDRRQRELMSNAYDNSVLYTDDVLANIIQRVDQGGALATLFYVADHGENLFDGDCGLAGHGRHTEFDFRVAAFFWHSAAFAQRFPAKVASAQAHRAAPLSTTNVFHSVLDMADIRFADEDLSASLFDARWRPRPRTVQTGLDFDLSDRDPVCKLLIAKTPSASRPPPTRPSPP